MTEQTARPWYRHVWPWLLIVPPAAAVIGGCFVLYLAIPIASWVGGEFAERFVASVLG